MGSRKVAQLFLRALVITNIVGFSSVCGVPPGFAQDTILRVDAVSASPGDTAIPVDITTSNSILVASTDLIVSYDTTALTATNVIVPHLSLSAANLDDAQGEVRLLTTAPMGVTLLANDILVTVIFDVEPNPQPGCYPLTLTDSDGGSDFEQR